jgi:hypothetical protein
MSGHFTVVFYGSFPCVNWQLEVIICEEAVDSKDQKIAERIIRKAQRLGYV